MCALLIVAIFPWQFTPPSLILLLRVARTIVVVGWVEMRGGEISWGRCSHAVCSFESAMCKRTYFVNIVLSANFTEL